MPMRCRFRDMDWEAKIPLSGVGGEEEEGGG